VALLCRVFRPPPAAAHRVAVLLVTFAIWAASCLAVGVIACRRAPAISVAMVGALIGAVGGFLAGNVDGPAEVPAYAAVGASVGLFATGLCAVVFAPARPPATTLARAGALVLGLAPVAAAGLTAMLRIACPLYVSGRRSGFCNYQGADLLGGWLTGVIIAFVVDAIFVAALLFVSSHRAKLAAAKDFWD
jgi:hypothetical protein